MCPRRQDPIDLTTTRLWFVLQTRGCQFSLLSKQQQSLPPAVHTSRGKCLASCPTLAYYSLEVSGSKGVVTALYNSASDAPYVV